MMGNICQYHERTMDWPKKVLYLGSCLNCDSDDIARKAGFSPNHLYPRKLKLACIRRHYSLAPFLGGLDTEPFRCRGIACPDPQMVTLNYSSSDIPTVFQLSREDISREYEPERLSIKHMAEYKSKFRISHTVLTCFLRLELLKFI